MPRDPRCSRALAGTDVPHPRADRIVRRHRRPRRRGLLPHGADRRLQRRASSCPTLHAGDAGDPPRAWASRWSTRSSALGRGRLRAVGLGRLRQARRLPRAAGRPLARRAGVATRRCRSTRTPSMPRRRRTSPPGCASASRRRGHPGSCTATSTPATSCSAATRPAVAAIVDWEMATIGDPLLDLGWLLATWDLDGRARGVRRPAHPRRRPADGRRAGRAVRRAARGREPRPAVAGTPCWPASSSASSSRARHARATSGPGARSRSATACTPPPSRCSSAPTTIAERSHMIDFQIPAETAALAERIRTLRRPRRSCRSRRTRGSPPHGPTEDLRDELVGAGPRGRAADLPGAEARTAGWSPPTSTRPCSSRRPAGRRSARWR